MRTRAPLRSLGDRFVWGAVHGADHDAQIAGEFANGSALSNEGERLVLADRFGNVVLAFTYDDRMPWPEEADGGGRSLVLSGSTRANFEEEALSTALRWRPSLAPGGAPGLDDHGPRFAGDPLADTNGNGTADLVDYYLGTMTGGRPPILDVALGASGSPRIVVTRRLGADDASHVVEASKDGTTWSANPPDLIMVERNLDDNGGFERIVYELTGPLLESGTRLLRLHIIAR